MTGIISGTVARDEVTAVDLPQFHPPEENLIDYVSGRGGNGWELVIEAHLSLCATCRNEVRRLKALGGALIEKLPAEDLPEGMEERVLDLLDSAEITTFPSSKCDHVTDLPRSIGQLLPDNLDDIRWRASDESGVESIDLPVPFVQILLLRIPAEALVLLGHPFFEYQKNGQLLILAGGMVSDELRLSTGDLKPLSELNENFYADDTTALTFCLLLLQDDN
ncbi:hypothetical protein [Kiloniella antarctica]|uniref:Zinc-finger domain-containing protein n=1 Tax=Kiloniella antarctica TaxID=1550907 RepID=A0ABW5BKC4_9PROT